MEAQRWALLIGVDFYMTGDARKDEHGNITHYPSLSGCVNDVALVECFLKEIGVPADHINKLTSTNTGHASKAALVEPPSQWPTYRNISNAFTDLGEKTKSGDLVYIHYSGHGARVTTAFGDLKRGDKIDEALVPFDIEVFSDSNQSRYVRDVELACWLQALVKKGLRISLVVDSCHSGSSTRAKGDVMVRGTGIVDHALLSTDIPKIPEITVPTLTTVPDETRHGQARTNWLLEPHGYTLLAGCCTSQSAHEFKFSEKLYGVFTYYLIDTLRSGPASMSPSMIQSSICAKVQSHFSNQTPILQGTDDTVFFGIKQAPRLHVVRVSTVNVQQNFVELDRGELHWVGKGAEYCIESNAGMALATVRVVDVQDIRSRAEFINSSEGNHKEKVKPGCVASLRKQALEKQVRVRLTVPGNARSPAIQRDYLSDFRRHVEQQDRHNSLWRLLADGDTGTPTLNIIVTDEGNFELLDASQTTIPDIPVLPAQDPKSLAVLTNCISHIAHYQLFQCLGPDQGSFLDTSCTFEVEGQIKSPRESEYPDLKQATASPQTLEPFPFLDDMYTVPHSADISILFRNSGQYPVYMTIFDLMPLWEIKKLYPALGGASECVLPGELRLLDIQMNISDRLLKMNRSEIFDTLRAVVTLNPTELGDFELPSIDGETIRGLSPAFNTKLDQQLQNLSRPSRDATLLHRSTGSWQVYDIRIKTIRREDSL